MAKWVTAQRMMYTKGQLSQDRIDKLEEISFVWRLVRSWDDNFERLQQYHEKNGNCDVPVDYEEDPKLGRWVKTQKAYSKKKELTQERLDKLLSVSFNWNAPKGANKNESANDSTSEMTKGTTTNMPTDRAARLRATNARLSEDRRLLEAENRELRRKLKEAEEANSWEDNFEQLTDYVVQHGDANVPVLGTKLGQWVSKQRDQYKQTKLSKERIDKLEGIGFEWVRQPGRPSNQSPTKEEHEPSSPPAKKQRIENAAVLAEEAQLEREKEKLAEAQRKLEEEKQKLRLLRENLQATKKARMK